MTLGQCAVLSVCLALGAPGAEAQTVDVEFQNGRVSVRAQNATPRQILAEWAKVGGTRIINGDRVPGTPMTIELVGVSERQALDVILRSASGYMAAGRTTGSGASGLDRVHILPTSTAPGRQGGAPAAGQAGRAMPVRPPVQAVPDTFENEPPLQEPGPVGMPNRVPPGQGGRPGSSPFPMTPNVVEPEDDVEDPDDDTDDQDEPPTPATQPGNPFGVAPGSNRPGVVNQPGPGQPGAGGRPQAR